MGKYMLSTSFKIRYFKIPHLKLCRFFRQSVTKIMGKTVILCFPPLLPLNNVEGKWAKFALSNVIGLQHCIGEQG